MSSKTHFSGCFDRMFLVGKLIDIIPEIYHAEPGTFFDFSLGNLVVHAVIVDDEKEENSND